jgi:hypothetical protein
VFTARYETKLELYFKSSDFGSLKGQPRSPVVKLETLRFTNAGFLLTTGEKQNEGTENPSFWSRSVATHLRSWIKLALNSLDFDKLWQVPLTELATLDDSMDSTGNRFSYSLWSSALKNQ